ncbi:MAG: DivIVA domain-containing protein [Ruminococcus sp.]|nr:DivIVA domain-containing protein [Ruminococcus sp.]
MITIDEIKNITFRQAKRKAGYNGDDVDAFVEDVIELLNSLKRKKLISYIKLMYLLQE